MSKQPSVVHRCHLLYRREERSDIKQKQCPLPARALITTNGKAFGSIINTSPMRSHLGLRPDKPAPTVASHIRASVSAQISIHTHSCPYESRLSGLPT